MDHDTRDLDGVIDEVAQAMTGAELRRDLRPAVSARIEGGPSWALGWRVATAATVIASVVLVVIVVRSGRELEPLPPADVATAQQTLRVEPRQPVPTTLPPRADLIGPLLRVEAGAVRHAPRAPIRRQRLGAITTDDVVAIDPLAIAPLDADEAQMVEIVPIEVEPVRISQLETIAE